MENLSMSKIIKNYLKEKNISKKDFAKLSELSLSTVNRLLNEKPYNYNIDTISKIANALDLHLLELIKLCRIKTNKEKKSSKLNDK